MEIPHTCVRYPDPCVLGLIGNSQNATYVVFRDLLSGRGFDPSFLKCNFCRVLDSLSHMNNISLKYET